MIIASWNVNSIRKRLTPVLEWLDQHKPDVLCMQETKVGDEEFPLMMLQASGYHVTFRGSGGFSGVATLSLSEPSLIMHGLHEAPDAEDDRVLLTVIDGIPIVNSYIPQGSKVDSPKYTYKLAFFRRLRRYFEQRLDPAKPALWVGDLNVAPEPIDVYHPDRRVNDPDYHIDAREAFKEAAAWGWVDCFRQVHPEKVQYTYWDYFRNAYKNNWGWRIDHVMATEVLAARCRRIEVDVKPREGESPSDHTPIWAEFDLTA
jgi:exodeoxyribonuclease-3